MPGEALRVNGCTLATDGQGIATLTFDLPGKVNVMNDDFMEVMEAFVARLESWSHLRGLVVTSAKRTFVAGGDLALMGRAVPGQEAFLIAHFERMKGYLRRLERLGKPVVAAINGSALGGGLEIALACHRRIASRRGDIVLGLPEINFGILPGAGGVVRMTHLIGMGPALDYLLTGKKVDVETALADGIVHDVAESESSLIAKSIEWIGANPAPVQPWDLPQRQAPRADGQAYGVAPDADAVAVETITRVARRSLDTDVDGALSAETKALVDLMIRPETHARIAAFFDRPKQARGAPA